MLTYKYIHTTVYIRLAGYIHTYTVLCAIAHEQYMYSVSELRGSGMYT